MSLRGKFFIPVLIFLGLSALGGAAQAETDGQTSVCISDNPSEPLRLRLTLGKRGGEADGYVYLLDSAWRVTEDSFDVFLNHPSENQQLDIGLSPALLNERILYFNLRELHGAKVKVTLLQGPRVVWSGSFQGPDPLISFSQDGIRLEVGCVN